MGAYRQVKTSTTSQSDWKVIPENDMSDVFIGSASHRQAWSTHQLLLPITTPRPHSSGGALMNNLVEEYSRPFRENGGFFPRNAEDFQEPQNGNSKGALFSLTSQILSELHGRGKAKPKKTLFSSPPPNSPRPQAAKDGRHTPLSRKTSNRELPTLNQRSKSALKFSERSLALSLLRSSSSLNQNVLDDTVSISCNASSDASLSPRDTDTGLATVKKSNGARMRRNVTQHQVTHRSAKDNHRTAATPTTSYMQATPSSPRDKFGSHDSGISNPDLYNTDQTFSIGRGRNANSNNTQTLRHRHSPGAMGPHSPTDIIHEVLEPDHQDLQEIQRENASHETSFSNKDRHKETSLNQRDGTKENKGRDEGEGEGEDEDEEDDDELPEYLDSFQTASAATFRRPSMWLRVRDLGTSSLIHDLSSTRTTSSLGNSVTSGIGGSSIHSNDAYDNVDRQDRKKKICPNCGEELQRAPTRFVAVKGNEKNFLSWLLGHWGKRKELHNYGPSAQRGYLPHYCNFVRSVNLHARPTANSNNNNNIITVTVDDNTDDGYITNTDQSHTDTEQEKSRPVKSAPAPLTGPSLTQRAESPSSTGYDPESLLERLQEQGLAGPRLPIQIPTPDLKPKEGEQTDSARSKEEGNSTRAVDKLTSTKNKEPVRKPLTPSSGSKGKGRTPCAKKEKTFTKEKKKKGKAKEDVDKRLNPDDQKTQVQQHKEDTPPEVEPVPAEPIIVDAKAPDLPTVDVPDGGLGTGKGKKKKGHKKLITPSKPVDKPKSNLIKEEPAHNFYDFGDIETTKAELEDIATASRAAKVPSYLNDRMVLSLQSSRFELPMDMKSLEKMTPADYLRKYCVISSRRKTLYQKIFQKHRERGGHIHGKAILSKALQEVLVNALQEHHLTELCDILEVEDDTSVDLQLFCGTAALAERILYPDYLTEDTAECTEYHRERVECADFCSLQWKLHGVQVSPPVRKILQALG